MNKEETMIMPPANSKAEDTTKETAPKSDKKENTGKKVAATAAAGVFGGAAGGAGSVAAADAYKDMMTEEEVEEQVEETVEESQPQPAPKVEPETVEVIPEEGPDYTGAQNADPLVQEPEPVQTSNTSDTPEVQVLGVYERTTEDGTHQELAILTNGEEVAAVLDATGDGEANLIAVDENHDGEFQEGEIHDVSDMHVDMSMYEQAYVAQQQEMEQHDTFDYAASDETDYNNDADVCDA